MQDAIRALSTSSRNRAVLSCSEHQHLLLRATAHLTQRTGVAEVRLGQVIREYWTLCQLEGYTAVSQSIWSHLCIYRNVCKYSLSLSLPQIFFRPMNIVFCTKK